MFDRLIRYLPVLDYIKNRKPSRILEVGSNSKGIGEFYSGSFTGLDLDFPEKPVSNMEAVKGSVVKLPFPDASFDLVFAVDVFEHLPEKLRNAAFSEMFRVVFGRVCDFDLNKSDRLKFKNQHDEIKKKAVIVGFPCGEGAEKLSKKMLEWFEKRGLGTAKWMREHVENGLPEPEFRIKNLEFRMLERKEKGVKLHLEEFWNENLFVCEWLLKMEENGRFLKIERYVLTYFRSELEYILSKLNFGKCYRKFWVINAC